MAEWSSRVQNALAALPRPPASAEALEVAGLNGSEWALLVYCFLNDPPFTLDELRRWLPYTSDALVERWFKELLATLNVQRVGGGDFVVTDKGSTLVKEWCRRGRAFLARQHPLSMSGLKRLANSLELVVTAALEKPTVATTRLSGSRRLAFEPLRTYQARIDQALTDLYYFREDCYVAAWMAAGLNGTEAELLTLVWRQNATDMNSLMVQLGESRGVENRQVADTAGRLASRGFVEWGEGRVAVTVAGRALRDGIEVATDRNYMPPWTELPPLQLQEARHLLSQFTRALSLHGRSVGSR